MKKLHLYLLSGFLLVHFNFFAQSLVPPIYNYSSIDYQAASQNWSISIDKNGIVYSANHQGLLIFDGQNWELHPLKSRSIIRSVYAFGDRIYTGSYKEFGYWKRSKTGKMGYTSLMPLLKNYSPKSEEIWGIISYKGDIYFRSFGAIYKYDGKEVKVVKKDIISTKMMVYNNRLLIAIAGKGVFYLSPDGNITPLADESIFEGKTIVDMEISGVGLLIGTRQNLYRFKNSSFTIYDDAHLNNELKKYELNHILSISSTKVVFGTVKKGIIFYDFTSRKMSSINRTNGLQNNTVLGLAINNSELWLGMDNGIDRITLDSPLEFYTNDTGELGAVYDLAFFKGNLYLGSNTGTYSFKNNDLKIIEGAEGHTWNLENISGSLYCNHNTGTYQIINNKFVPLENRTGSFQFKKIPNKASDYFIGSYTGLEVYNSKTKDIYSLKNINFPVKKMLFENDTTLWVAHPYEGIYKVVIDNDLDSAVSVKKINTLNGSGNFNPEIFKIKNRISIWDHDKWYDYNSFTDSLEVFNELQKYNFSRLLLQNENLFCFIDSKQNSLVFTNFKDIKVILPAERLQNRLIKGNEKIIKANDSIYYITLKDGFARLNFNKLLRAQKKQQISKPLVSAFKSNGRRYGLLNNPHISYSSAKNVEFLISLPLSDATTLQYSLIGRDDTLKGEVSEGGLRFQNLTYGNYILRLTAYGPDNGSNRETDFKFVVNPPWYWSTGFKVIYILLGICIIVIIYWYNKIKLKKHRLMIEKKYEKEHEEKLSKIEKDKLLHEITIKRKELANTTMIAAKKNEILMEIQKELNKDRKNFSNQFRLKHIMTKINKAVKDKDEWKVFETNFNEVHEDFFKDLLEAFPNLTNKDLKLSSYLKMNLTSKEIAPLMGISVRGVEIHRYRLRKKMGLEKAENLTNYLIKNF